MKRVNHFSQCKKIICKSEECIESDNKYLPNLANVPGN